MSENWCTSYFSKHCSIRPLIPWSVYWRWIQSFSNPQDQPVCLLKIMKPIRQLKKSIHIKMEMIYWRMYRGKNQTAVFQEELLTPSDQYDLRALPESTNAHECFETNKKRANYRLFSYNYRKTIPSGQNSTYVYKYDLEQWVYVSHSQPTHMNNGYGNNLGGTK